jgi:hypothetical protein
VCWVRNNLVDLVDHLIYNIDRRWRPILRERCQLERGEVTSASAIVAFTELMT